MPVLTSESPQGIRRAIFLVQSAISARRLGYAHLPVGRSDPGSTPIEEVVLSRAMFPHEGDQAQAASLIEAANPKLVVGLWEVLGNFKSWTGDVTVAEARFIFGYHQEAKGQNGLRFDALAAAIAEVAPLPTAFSQARILPKRLLVHEQPTTIFDERYWQTELSELRPSLDEILDALREVETKATADQPPNTDELQTIWDAARARIARPLAKATTQLATLVTAAKEAGLSDLARALSDVSRFGFEDVDNAFGDEPSEHWVYGMLPGSDPAKVGRAMSAWHESISDSRKALSSVLDQLAPITQNVDLPIDEDEWLEATAEAMRNIAELEVVASTVSFFTNETDYPCDAELRASVISDALDELELAHRPVVDSVRSLALMYPSRGPFFATLDSAATDFATGIEMVRRTNKEHPSADPAMVESFGDRLSGTLARTRSRLQQVARDVLVELGVADTTIQQVLQGTSAENSSRSTASR